MPAACTLYDRLRARVREAPFSAVNPRPMKLRALRPKSARHQTSLDLALFNRNRRPRRAEAPVHSFIRPTLVSPRERGSGDTHASLDHRPCCRARKQAGGRVRGPRTTMVGPTPPTSRRQPTICPSRSLLLRRDIFLRPPSVRSTGRAICHRPPGLRCRACRNSSFASPAAAGGIGIALAGIAPMRDSSVHTSGPSGKAPRAVRLAKGSRSLAFSRAHQARCAGFTHA